MVFNEHTGEVIAYTPEERLEALDVSLTSLASFLGYTIKKEGKNYSLEEMDSLIIYNDRSWNRFSGRGKITGGTQIDFLMAFGGATSAAQAIQQLLSFKNSNTVTCCQTPAEEMFNPPHKEMILPPKNDNYRRVFAYLIKTRGLSQEVVADFVHRKLIYEDSVHHNIVFLGYDPEGNIKYAGLRGTADVYGKKFKMDVPGNDKNYGVNIVNKDSNELKVFESVIDCMSYIDLFKDNTSNKLVLGMVADNPLQQFLKDYDHIKRIVFCLDNDEAGLKAMLGNGKYGNEQEIGLVGLYRSRAYETDYEIPKKGKDWNEELLYNKHLQVSKDNKKDDIGFVSNIHKRGR